MKDDMCLIVIGSFMMAIAWLVGLTWLLAVGHYGGALAMVGLTGFILTAVGLD
jgi:hypothetical protein